MQLMLLLLCTRDNFDERMFSKATFLPLGLPGEWETPALQATVDPFLKKGILYLLVDC